MFFTFEIKDLGQARYVIGMKTVRSHPRKLLGMCQEAYIKKVSEHFQIHNPKPIDTPVEKSLTLSLSQCPKIDDEKRK